MDQLVPLLMVNKLLTLGKSIIIFLSRPNLSMWYYFFHNLTSFFSFFRKQITYYTKKQKKNKKPQFEMKGFQEKIYIFGLLKFPSF